MNRSRPVLVLAGLNITIDGARILEDVGITLHSGRIHVVLGASGSGKSTLLRTLMGLHRPGVIVQSSAFRLSVRDGLEIVRDWDLGDADERVWAGIRGSRIGMVFQDSADTLTPLRRVGSLLAEASRGIPQPCRTATGNRLHEAGIDEHAGVERNYCFELSGGMAQRVGFALAVAGEPAVLLADEPSTALDGVARRALADALRRRAEGGASVLLVTHDRALASALADDVTVLHAGRCQQTGPAEEVLAALPQRGGGRTSDAGVHVADSANRAIVPSGGVTRSSAVRIRGLHHGYSAAGRDVLRGVDLDLGEGESLGLLGRSGSGKSTLIKCLVGLERPRAGTIEVAGLAAWNHPWKRLRREIQLIPQDPRAALNPWRTALQQIMDPLDFHRIGTRRGRLDRATELLDLVGLTRLGDRRPDQLSTGQCQRVSIARAMAVAPSVLVADEPVTALDGAARTVMLGLLRTLCRSSGAAMLVVSHDIEALEELCPRIAVLHDGAIVEELVAGRLEQAVSDPARSIIDAYFSLASRRFPNDERKGTQ
ncbi:ABC transporter ATP-binding protein [Agromyces sp. NPDC058136]|uniref:ABC transporter ATP-binding protein n=1 Tax=Agromyces sp. NPDC058136 TaxID=3346354 RepID=UPI0036DE39F4